MPEPTYSSRFTGYHTHVSCDTCGVVIAESARQVHTAWHERVEGGGDDARD